MDRGFKGVWIPKEIWLHKGLTLQEKIMLVEVDSLDNENGCFAGNDHFAEFLGVSERQVQRMIKSLKEKGFIAVNFKFKPNSKEIESRSIRIVQANYPRFIPAPIAQEIAPEVVTPVSRGVVTKMSFDVVTDMSQGGDGCVADSNTLTNNTSIKSNTNNKGATPSPDFTGTNFSPAMIETVNLWLEYKAEQKKAYKPVGLKSLITTIKNKVEQYGEQAVIELITECMGANYQGIIWDKLTKQQPVPVQSRQQPKQSASTGNPFADMLRQMQADKSQPDVVGVYDAKEVK